MENKKIVYFDKNIFSILKNEYKSGNTNNFNKIINSKNKFLYVYSMAHIFDLQNDKTNKKEEDFEFMSQIVDSNYLYYFEQEERFCIDHNIKITDKYKKAENFDDMFKQMDLDYIDKFLELLKLLGNVVPIPPAIIKCAKTAKKFFDSMKNKNND